MVAPADRLIVALDVPSAEEARAVIAALGPGTGETGMPRSWADFSRR